MSMVRVGMDPPVRAWARARARAMPGGVVLEEGREWGALGVS